MHRPPRPVLLSPTTRKNASEKTPHAPLSPAAHSASNLYIHLENGDGLNFIYVGMLYRATTHDEMENNMIPSLTESRSPRPPRGLAWVRWNLSARFSIKGSNVIPVCSTTFTALDCTKLPWNLSAQFSIKRSNVIPVCSTSFD